MCTLFIFALCLAMATGDNTASRIVGGSLTSISQYPFAAVLLNTFSGPAIFNQECGGSIINNRAVLTAAHCFDWFPLPHQWRVRVGSEYYNKGGVVRNTNRIIRHPNLSGVTLDYDIAILRINGAFSFNENVRVGFIAGPNYNLPDNAPTWIVGWGDVRHGGPGSEQLRHVQVRVVNQSVCKANYAELKKIVTDNMMCSGHLNSGVGACQGDSGGPVIHNNVIVGVVSWGYECGRPRYPTVNVRVSRFTSWIENNF